MRLVCAELWSVSSPSACFISRGTTYIVQLRLHLILPIFVDDRMALPVANTLAEPDLGETVVPRDDGEDDAEFEIRELEAHAVSRPPLERSPRGRRNVIGFPIQPALGYPIFGSIAIHGGIAMDDIMARVNDEAVEAKRLAGRSAYCESSPGRCHSYRSCWRVPSQGLLNYGIHVGESRDALGTVPCEPHTDRPRVGIGAEDGVQLIA